MARWLVLLVTSACGLASAQPAQQASIVPAALERADIRAQLSPRRFTTLSAEIPARLARIAVKEGDAFKSGQTLAQLDCSLQASARDRARAALGGAQKTFSAQKRLDELNATGKLEVQTAQAEVDKLKAELAQINTTLSKCTITAPFAGRVADQKARENQYVQAGQPILDILDDSTLELEFIVPSKWLRWLKAGHKFEVEIDETGKKYPAHIQRLGARIDPVSQSLKASAVIDGKYPELLAGMSGRLLLSPPQ
ncbi:efflux RND transporter periplasmic adaptor subunit [Azonexus hydrophilus]|uniref:efflux RND transporter periplasmic adaptor subunit n=1 Tax=Azonexus hydrophilus TaxID=418702 RepID=UPI0005BBB5BF|nr:efflux RND transporter periplasmic adaptor subunit [Azonexus hydrophilus]